LPNIRTLASFRSPPFRFYFFGMIGQWAALSMLTVAQSLLVFRITNSLSILGILALGSAIPQLLFFLVGGSMADRFPKKRLIQIGQGAAGVMALVAAVTISIGYMTPEHPNSWWVLMATSTIQGIFNAVAIPARQAIIPNLVKPDSLMNALALNQMGANVFRLLAPAAAGFIIDGAGFAAAFYVMAGLYGMAVILTAFIPEKYTPTAHDRSTIAEAGEGLRYIWNHRVIFLILSYAICYIILFMPYQTMLPVFTETILKVGATELGFLQSVMGIGALAASLVMASISNRRRGVLVLTGGMISGLGLVFFSASHWWYFSLAAMFVVGVGQSIHGTALVTAMQTLTEQEYMGRVMSILMMNQGLSGVGTFFVGFLSEGVGVQWAIGGFAAVLALLSISFLLFAPKVRKI
jgi:MFS family permease